LLSPIAAVPTLATILMSASLVPPTFTASTATPISTVAATAITTATPFSAAAFFPAAPLTATTSIVLGRPIMMLPRFTDFRLALLWFAFLRCALVWFWGHRPRLRLLGGRLGELGFFRWHLQAEARSQVRPIGFRLRRRRRARGFRLFPLRGRGRGRRCGCGRLGLDLRA
jgi:hypothetical protein